MSDSTRWISSFQIYPAPSWSTESMTTPGAEEASGFWTLSFMDEDEPPARADNTIARIVKRLAWHRARDLDAQEIYEAISDFIASWDEPADTIMAHAITRVHESSAYYFDEREASRREWRGRLAVDLTWFDFTDRVERQLHAIEANPYSAHVKSLQRMFPDL